MQQDGFCQIVPIRQLVDDITCNLFLMIKNIVLDFGGVIYEIDHVRQMEAFRKLGINDFEKLYSHAIQSPLFTEYECGRISNNDFREQLIRLTGIDLSFKQIDHAWNSILVGFIDESITLLETVKCKYNLYLLSNTTSIHYDVYIKEFTANWGYDFNNLFIKSYWSFKSGMRKPGKDIYRFVLSDAGLKGHETLFIDDTLINVESAKNAGMHGYWLQSGSNLKDLFDDQLALML